MNLKHLHTERSGKEHQIKHRSPFLTLFLFLFQSQQQEVCKADICRIVKDLLFSSRKKYVKNICLVSKIIWQRAAEHSGQVFGKFPVLLPFCCVFSYFLFLISVADCKLLNRVGKQLRASETNGQDNSHLGHIKTMCALHSWI